MAKNDLEEVAKSWDEPQIINMCKLMYNHLFTVAQEVQFFNLQDVEVVPGYTMDELLLLMEDIVYECAEEHNEINRDLKPIFDGEEWCTE